ncbi:MAG: chloride channel protein [Ruminococcaceae bacterium]|nr:chloride channel protein [Oscillospiraceae bacterium]
MLKNKINCSDFKKIFNNPVAFLKWVLISVAVGFIVGAVGVAFHFAVDFATEIRTEHPWIIYFLPVGGLVIVLIYKLCKKENNKGTNDIILAVRENKTLSILIAPLIFISSTITHLFGGSSGREGAALQLGGSIAFSLGKLFRLDEKDHKIIVMCGMSAAFAALFGTPVSAAIFSLEITSVGIMHFSALVPCTVSAIVGTKLAELFGIIPTHFELSGLPDFSILSLLKVGGLAVLCAILSIWFCTMMHKSEKMYSRFLKNRYLRIAAGGAIVVLFTLLVGSYDYNGAGMDIVEKAISGTAKNEAFLVKMLFTALTLSAGYKGGEIVPVFFTGATFGNVAGKLLRLSPSFGAGIGLVSLFCGVTNCPITSIILSVELFGAEGIIYFLLSCAISYMLSGNSSLYHDQKIIYSKFTYEIIDKKTQ